MVTGTSEVTHECFAVADDVDSELALEKEQLRLSMAVEDKRGEEKDVKELSDCVVSRKVSRSRPGERHGNGAVFNRFLGSSFLLVEPRTVPM